MKLFSGFLIIPYDSFIIQEQQERIKMLAYCRMPVRISFPVRNMRIIRYRFLLVAVLCIRVTGIVSVCVACTVYLADILNRERNLGIVTMERNNHVIMPSRVSIGLDLTIACHVGCIVSFLSEMLNITVGFRVRTYFSEIIDQFLEGILFAYQYSFGDQIRIVFE